MPKPYFLVERRKEGRRPIPEQKMRNNLIGKTVPELPKDSVEFDYPYQRGQGMSIPHQQEKKIFTRRIKSMLKLRVQNNVDILYFHKSDVEGKYYLEIRPSMIGQAKNFLEINNPDVIKALKHIENLRI